MNSWLWVACLFIVSPAAALDTLPPETEQAFYDGVHGYFDCVDCHTDTTSSTIARDRLPAVCGDCHPKARTDFEKSVHWGGGKAETVCTDCHGIHDIDPVSQPTSKAYRSLVCGDCHIGPMEHFATGPHHPAFEVGGQLACASCHSNHAVLSPTIDVVREACEACHPADSDAFAFGQTFGQRIEAVRTALDDANEKVSVAEVEGVDTRGAQSAIQNAHAAYTQTRLVWHGLDDQTIRSTAEGALAAAETATADLLRSRATLDRRKLWLIVVWVFILVSVVLLALKKRSLDARSSSS